MVNINNATYKELLSIVHIGPQRAKDIIAQREIRPRPFKDIYELSSLTGFGKKRIDDIINEGILVC